MNNKRNVTEAYRKLSNIISSIDNNVQAIKQNNYRLREINNEKESLEESLEDLNNEKLKLIEEGKKIAAQSGLPFSYVEPEDDEWDSSDDWNSSSQYC